MSVCKTEEDSGASEEAGAPPPSSSREHYEPKSASKIVRVLTVSAYLFSVSFAAILLSVYYICIWKSPTPPTNHGRLSARRGDLSDYTNSENEISNGVLTRGGNSTVNETNLVHLPANFTNFTEETGEPFTDTDMTLEPVTLDTTQESYNETSDDTGTNVTIAT